MNAGLLLVHGFVSLGFITLKKPQRFYVAHVFLFDTVSVSIVKARQIILTAWLIF